MHLFDLERRFMGGYGIVGGNLPIAAGLALAADYRGEDDATLCMMGDGATNQGTFGETMNLAALWDLPVVFMVVNNQFGMGTALARHSAETDLSVKARGFGIPGTKCDGMDVLDTHAVVSEALRCAREQRKPQLIEAMTYRYRGHSMADPEEYRSKEEVQEWRKRDPILAFGKRLKDDDIVSGDDLEAMDKEAIETVDEAVRFADESPFPELASLYDDIYVYGEQVQGWHTVDQRSPDIHAGEREREAPAVSHRLAEAGAAYADIEDEHGALERRPEAGEPHRDEEGGGG
jgi:pyruvate dehydrogenase E1 component alpha subunit